MDKETDSEEVYIYDNVVGEEAECKLDPKAKAKAKAKASEAEPKPKKKAAPRAHGKGKAKRAELEPEPRPEPVAAEAIVKAGNSAPGVQACPEPPMEPIPTLPHMVAELEAILPQFFGEAFSITDEMDPNKNTELEALKFSDMPDLVWYITLELRQTDLQYNALKELYQGEGDDGIDKLCEPSVALWDMYSRLLEFHAGTDAEQENPSVSVTDDGDFDMGVADDAGE